MGLLNFISNLKKKKLEQNKYCDSLIERIQLSNQEIDNMWKTYNNDVIPRNVVSDIQTKGASIIKETEYKKLLEIKKAKNINQLFSMSKSFKQSFCEFNYLVECHNNIIWDNLITEARNLIGQVEGIDLDNQQMKCIIKDAHNHLVLAGAGTGKTTTIVGKIKYMLKRQLLKPEEILVLSFTNASAKEMSERINKESGYSIDASTFHKLGLNILTDVNKQVPKITKLSLFNFIKKQLLLNMKDQQYLRKLGLYLYFNRVSISSEFDFSTEAEYKEFLKLNPPRTVKGENVKSYGELTIANFLYENGINYEYEAAYKIDTNDENYGQYHPDFYLPDYDTYIEYFGIDKDGNVPEYFLGRDGLNGTEAYQASMKWKRELHKENETTLIECYGYEQLDGTLLDLLEEKLIENNVQMNPISTEELWKQITNEDEHGLDGMIELFETVINLIKSNRYTVDDVRSLNKSGYNYRSVSTLLFLIEPIFNSYCKYLDDNNEIDFNDMINLSIEAVQSGQYKHNYKLVIVDEYQDISKPRFLLLDSMRKIQDYDLFCVGDDWQSIYRFAGSDIGLTLRFDEYWGDTEISKIETTYRFSQSLIDVSSDFIMSNPEQIEKDIQGKNESVGFSVGEICGYTEEYAIQFMSEKINELPENSSVFFIGRYSFDIKMLEDSEFFDCKYDNVKGIIHVTHHKRKDLKMNFITAHKAKGLQADYVFIINNKSSRMGFPSRIQNSAILSLLLDDFDNYPYAEERRLFYVALTRAKKKAILVTIENKESDFVLELKGKYGKEIKREAFECPLCGYRLVKKTGPYGEFWGCSNYPITGCRFTRKIQNKQEE